MDLVSKVVLLTGARRVGAVVAAVLAKHGADIAIVYNRSQTEAQEAAASVRAAGRRAVIVQGDVSQAEGCAAIVAEVERQLGRLDVLINMASIYQSVPYDETGPETWDRQMAVDLRGAFLCARAAVPIMRKHGGGRIINFSDWVAASGRPRYKGFVAYYVAKAGVKHDRRWPPSSGPTTSRERVARADPRRRPIWVTSSAKLLRRDTARAMGRAGGDRQGGPGAYRLGLHR